MLEDIDINVYFAVYFKLVPFTIEQKYWFP